MSNFDSKKFQIQLTRADQPNAISTYTDDYMEAISLVQCFNDGFAENGVDGKAELIIQDKLEQWKQTIRQQVHYVDVKPYSHNIISLALKEIDDLFGATVVNEVIEEFNLEKLGWDKADCESDNNFDSKKINIQELKQAINGLADNWLKDEQGHYEESGIDDPNYRHGDFDSDDYFDASEVPTAELNRNHNYTHLRILLDFIQTLEGREAPEQRESDNEVDNEEAAWCEAGEHFVRPHNMWPDFADCVDCTTYKEYKEYIDEEG